MCKQTSHYLTEVTVKHIQSTKSALAKYDSISVVADEATDAQDKYILHIFICTWQLERPSYAPFPNRACSAQGGKFFSTVSQAVAKAIVNYSLDFSKVLAFPPNNVMYVCKAFSAVLQGMMPSAIHITCKAHILSMASDIWRTCFPDVDVLVSSFKKISKHCPSCKI